MVLYGGASSADRRRALESRITAGKLVQLFDDDGDGAVTGTDLEQLETTLADADDIVTGILLNKGWTLDGLEVLKTDRQVVRAWVDIAAQLAGERRTEWLYAQGRGMFDAFGVRGRTELGKLARAELRSPLEAAGAGLNETIEGEYENRPRFFAPDPSDPNDRGPGGF